MSYAAEKQVLRRQTLAARDALDPLTRHAQSRQICALIAASSLALRADTIALYAPIGSEVNVTSLLTTLIRAKKTVCLPRMRVDKRLDFAAVTSWEGLHVRTFGVAEPDGPALALEQLDLVLAPGLAFDAQGGRLGYGAGYYDRTFSGYTGAMYGAAFSQQIHVSLPMAPHDRLLDGIVCELGIQQRHKPPTTGQTDGPVAP